MKTLLMYSNSRPEESVKDCVVVHKAFSLHVSSTAVQG